jgi:hypothetical protein
MKINLLGGFFTKTLPCFVLLSACGSGAHEQYAEMPTNTSLDSTSVGIVQPINTAKEVKETLQELDSELAEQLRKKKFIYTVSMRAKVKNVEKATTQLWQLAHKFEGYITASDLTTSILSTRFMPLSTDSLVKINNYMVENQVVLCMPVQHLDTALLELSLLYYFLENHHIKAEDVTLNLANNQLKAKLFAKTSQKIAQAIDKKGEKLEEITQAEQQSADRQAQAIHEQLTKLDLLDKVAFAQIEIHFYQEPLTLSEKIENPETDKYEPSFEQQLTESLKIGWHLLLALVIHLAKIWFLLPVIAFAYWVYKKYF